MLLVSSQACFHRPVFFVVSAVVSLAYLLESVVIILLGFLLPFKYRGCHRVEGMPHVHAVKPYLMGVYGLMPPHAILCPRLFFKLLEDCLQCFVRLLFGEQLVHAQYEASRTGVVKVEILVLVARDVSLFVNHSGRVSLQIAYYAVAAIRQVSVEHCLQFYSAGVVPARLLGEIEHVG